VKRKKNKIPKGFLKKHRTGVKGAVRYLPLDSGFLKLEYDEDMDHGMLYLVSFVLDRDKDAMAVGCRLEMTLFDDDEGDVVTYIAESGVSGLQWAHGGVYWGHTYDDDTGPVPVRRIGLDEWVDECIDKMINPPQEDIEQRRRLDAQDEIS
jgi:hypothetical protein